MDFYLCYRKLIRAADVDTDVETADSSTALSARKKQKALLVSMDDKMTKYIANRPALLAEAKQRDDQRHTELMAELRQLQESQERLLEEIKKGNEASHQLLRDIHKCLTDLVGKVSTYI